MADLSRLALDSRLLVSNLRLIDPKLFKPEPLPAGTTSSEATLAAKDLPGLVRTAALAISGFADAAADRAPSVLWRNGASELLVLPGGVQTKLADGIVALSVPVRCDQSGDAFVHMSFFVGAPDRPAGLVAATEPRPRGPASSGRRKASPWRSRSPGVLGLETLTTPSISGWAMRNWMMPTTSASVSRPTRTARRSCRSRSRRPRAA